MFTKKQGPNPHHLLVKRGASRNFKPSFQPVQGRQSNDFKQNDARAEQNQAAFPLPYRTGIVKRQHFGKQGIAGQRRAKSQHGQSQTGNQRGAQIRPNP